MFNQTLGVSWEILREFDLALQDILVNSHRIIITERIYTDEHFVDENAQAPPIHRFSVTLLQENLRSEVLRRSAQGVCLAVYELREAEVCQLEVALLID